MKKGRTDHSRERSKKIEEELFAAATEYAKQFPEEIRQQITEAFLLGADRQTKLLAREIFECIEGY